MSNYIDTPSKYDAFINQAAGGASLIDQRLFSSEIRELSEAYNAAVALERGGLLAQANARYEFLLRRWPTFIAARHNLAANLAQVGEFDHARMQIEQAIANGGSDAHTFTTAGTIYSNLGDPYTELAYYHRAHQADPTYKPALFFMVITYRQLGWWNVARGWLEVLEAQLRPFMRSSPHLVDRNDAGRLEWNWVLTHEHFSNWPAALRHLESFYEISGDTGVLAKLEELRRRVSTPSR